MPSDKPYRPHTDADIAEMLKVVGLSSTDELFKDIPPDVRLKKPLRLPEPLSEPELIAHLRDLSEQNADLTHTTCFLGAGAYMHYVPSAVKSLISRSEFMTAYTPYQAEASQGTLQALYEYQSMICALTGMEIANSSLYDGATATTEAVTLAAYATGRSEVLIPQNIHPETRAVLQTYAKWGGRQIREFAWDPATGQADLKALENAVTDKTAAVIIQQPNFFGVIEDIGKLEGFAEAIHKKGALLIVNADPISLGILKSPADYGADVVVGEGQSLGNAIAFGGPYAGFFATKKQFSRLVPGRIVGQTEDSQGRIGFTLTLQTREQHIRREKATSNICTSQVLNALAGAMYLACVGRQGLQKVAEVCLTRSNALKQKLAALDGFHLPFSGPTFKEFVVESDHATAQLNRRLLDYRIRGGLDLGRYFAGCDNQSLICVTEIVPLAEVERFVKVLSQIGSPPQRPDIQEPVPQIQLA